MTNKDLSQARWRVSSKSSGNGQCTEVAFVDRWLVRDSKNKAGGMLMFSPCAWSALVRRLGDDEINRSE